MENKGVLLGLAAVAIIGIALFAFGQNNNSGTASQVGTTPTTAQAPVGSETSPTAMAMEATEASSYKDGTYEATGTYTSPAGEEEVEVEVTLKDGTIEDVDFVGLASDPKSVFNQKLFSDNYKTLVEGKNIDEVQLDKVSGSSLTPKGFNDAINKIKAEAQG
jgi:uncharacterized protein with FMN-binding domain